MAPYLNTIKSFLPSGYAKEIDSLDAAGTALLEAVVRFTSGGECPEGAPVATRSQWTAQQSQVAGALEQLKSSGLNHKRAREDESVDQPDAKKAKSAVDGPLDDDDPPLYTLHSISVTSPLRKKLNVSVHRSSFRFISPTTNAMELSIPLSLLTRAFLLPTRGKTKPHWTVLVMSGDTPLPTGKAAASTSAATKEEQPQVIFGVDATPPPFSITDYSSSLSATPTLYPKGNSILPFLRAFLSHLPFHALEPSISVFRSALSIGDGSAGVMGYRGAKSGTLWFLAEGILWDGKPCEFWPLGDLAGGRRNTVKGQADVDLGGAEGVRTVSATGRTCTVILRRKLLAGRTIDQNSMDVEQDEEEASVDTDVDMVDGKELEVIARWVKKYRYLFGVAPAEDGEPAAAKPSAGQEDSDADDSDFEQTSSDGGSPTSTSDEDSDNEGGGDDNRSDAASEELGSGSDRSEDAEDEEENEEEELSPAHHPLLKPGAMPKMSRAAIDAVVGMVQDDLMGGATSLERRGANDTGESRFDEEDELED